MCVCVRVSVCAFCVHVQYVPIIHSYRLPHSPNFVCDDGHPWVELPKLLLLLVIANVSVFDADACA